MKRIFAILFAIAMLASACSGGDGLAIQTSDGASGDSGDSSDSTTPADSPATDGSSEEATVEESSSSSSSSSGGVWCGRAATMDETMENLDITAGLGAIGQVRDAMQALLSDAPNEIKGDVAISLEGLDLIVGAIEDAGGDIFDADLSVLEELDEAKFENAADNIESYLAEVCGLDLSESDPDTNDVEVDDVISDDGNITIPSGVLDQMADAFKDLGMSDDDANCLAESMIANGVNAEDASAFFDFLETCGMTMEDLLDLNG
jgi:hypothetical protein